MARKTTDDLAAREAARKLIDPTDTDLSGTTETVDKFVAVEFETATSRAAGETIKLRRVTLTGPWEVVRTP
jgi:hypothetical protein